LADIDYSALFSDDPAAAQGQAAALAQAIARRRAAGQLGLITADPGISAVGKELTGDADKMEQSLVGAAQHRAQQELQRQHYAVEAQQMADLMRHRQVLEGQGQERVDQNAARLKAYEKHLETLGWRYNSNTGQFENVGARSGGGTTPAPAPAQPRGPLLPSATGALAPPRPAPSTAGPGRSSPLAGKMLDKALKELGSDFDPSGGRAGEFGKNQARVNAAKRVLALATDENGNAKDLNPQQAPELAQSIASLISNGGQGTQAQIEHMTPKTLRGNLQGTLQWLLGEPRGADQVAFVKNMIETAKREQDIAQQSIEGVRKGRAAKHQRVLLGNPEESRRVLQGFGWDLGPDGMPVLKGATAADAPAAAPRALPPGKARFRNKATGQTAIGPKGAAPDGWEVVP